MASVEERDATRTPPGRAGKASWVRARRHQALRWLGLEGPVPLTEADRAFRSLAAVHVASAVGDTAVTVALAGSVFFSTGLSGARGRVALSLLVTLAPFAVVAPFLGPAIDRSRVGRRWMVIGSAVGRSLTCVYMAGVVHELLFFLPSALVLLVLSKGYAVAKSSLVPNTVASGALLVRAGSRLAVLAAGAGLAAGAVAAGLLHLAGAPWVLRFAAVIYAGGAAMGSRLTTVPQPAVVAAATERQGRVLGLARAAGAMAVLRAAVGFTTFAVAFDLRAAHASTWWYGAIAGAGLAGGFLGNAVSPALRRGLDEERMLLAGLLVTCASGIAAWWLGGRLSLVLFSLVLGFAAGIARLSFDAVVQRDAEDRERSRSFARFEATFQLGWVAAALVATLVAGRGLPIAATPLAVAIATGAAGAWYTAGAQIGRGRGHGPSRAPFVPNGRRAPSREPQTGPRRNPLRAAGSAWRSEAR